MGSIISGVGGVYTGMQQQAAATDEWHANDALLQYQSRLSKQQAGIAEGKVRMLGGKTAAAQNVAYANSGVDASTGTAAAVQANTAAQTELDAQTVKNNAAREAWGFKVKQQEAKRTYDAKMAQGTATIVGGAGGVVNGFTDVVKMGG